MQNLVIPTIIANLLATGCAMLLIRRGPTRRLKLLSLTVGLISLTQTAALLHSSQLCTSQSSTVVELHQIMTGGMSLAAICLLGFEIFDRARTERKLRLAEYVAMPPSSKADDPRTITGTGLVALRKYTSADQPVRMNA